MVLNKKMIYIYIYITLYLLFDLAKCNNTSSMDFNDDNELVTHCVKCNVELTEYDIKIGAWHCYNCINECHASNCNEPLTYQNCVNPIENSMCNDCAKTQFYPCFQCGEPYVVDPRTICKYCCKDPAAQFY
jgi:hypothetical protein